MKGKTAISLVFHQKTKDQSTGWLTKKHQKKKGDKKKNKEKKQHTSLTDMGSSPVKQASQIPLIPACRKKDLLGAQRRGV